MKKEKEIRVNIIEAPIIVARDLKYAILDSEGTISRFKRSISSLLGIEWESLEWEVGGVRGAFTKLFIYFFLFCIFPAIPMFMIMALLYKFSQFGFHYTRLL